MTTTLRSEQVKDALLAGLAASDAINKAKRQSESGRTTRSSVKAETSQSLSAYTVIGAALVFGLGLATGVGCNRL